ncbi:50S ribosomal protein L21 [Candidatus Collierbacteria bacterium RIFOXYB2_FULL_46_14]|uniref:Large ribosomal subunit protein bL21 n=1 Tax=Candidatus Collierbacteria bacterium GW2011_GWA2_46_26 TaxID=1618381 RepID=A0A0G1PM08_9BACT|nr:MAG: 50S ribosomal protein L21 [Candidatus Collierbacteria bacterium GW2011_GWC2_44_13]KKU33771.1 MAG: 50S ribosomal protein L21 [Candidatus Collierbacteria bacterium GW2011_GWA2_46_26]OGD73156.1 MAG: 50S ribosomal protein L21 [Candidatus Collierbacteria bacterium RIFOXYB2_FULL_46_14]OGD76198.1 MAG: 50S ribosomal protein L21 [Candidatus Collierbacteria bacterium RIFOXYA2_FULL_46_20]OGD77534.1 MAG: 50S ribosomal protein L21 [Candidatus Collierbacteria bacterium RIFOXYC2_FULL_43_15]OGD80824.1
MADKTTYAVIQLGAKQYLVKEGDKVVAEKIDIKEGETLQVKEVLLGYDGEKTTIGEPYLEKATVDLIMEGTKKGEKIRIAKFKAKSRYRRVTGHRQLESHFTVKAINL